MKNLFKAFCLKLIYIIYRWCKKYVKESKSYVIKPIITNKPINIYIDSTKYKDIMYRITDDNIIKEENIEYVLQFIDVKENIVLNFYTNQEIAHIRQLDLMTNIKRIMCELNYKTLYENKEDAKAALIEKLTIEMDTQNQEFLTKINNL